MDKCELKNYTGVPIPEGVSDVVARFMRYVQVWSTSNPNNSDEVPSSPMQFDMARMLEKDLLKLGCLDVAVSDHAYVTATVPASAGAEDLPALGLCGHMDSAPDAPGKGVRPHIVHYEGGPLVAGIVDGKPVQTTPEMVPDLEKFVGMDIVCSDGTTLLSGDDKAGVAEIMALIARLQADPTIPHPTLKIAFVPDEEIGHGAELLDIDKFGAKWCYTVDGGALGEINYETFSASEVNITIKGVAVHPGEGKNILVNAITLAHQFDALVPANERPEHTEGYEGFFMPTEISGNESEIKMQYIIRDFNNEKFAVREQLMRDVAEFLNKRYGEGTIEVSIRSEYRNMAERLVGLDFLIDHAIEANHEAGVADVRCVAARGGTDGSQLTFRGLPCPNLATGAYGMHSIREFVPVPSLETMVDVLQNLVAYFAVPQKEE